MYLWSDDLNVTRSFSSVKYAALTVIGSMSGSVKTMVKVASLSAGMCVPLGGGCGGDGAPAECGGGLRRERRPTGCAVDGAGPNTPGSPAQDSDASGLRPSSTPPVSYTHLTLP